MTAADQPTTEPSAERVYQAWHGTDEPWGGCADREAVERILALLAPAPQPAANTEGVRHFAPWGSYRASCGVEVPRGASEDTGFTFRRDRTTCPDCRSHFTNPADADTERDEQLREARTLVSVLRRYPGDRQTPAVRALLVLEEEAARLDAVVTAVRDEVARWNVEPVVTERDRERRALGVSILRALDGGAA